MILILMYYDTDILIPNYLYAYFLNNHYKKEL